MSYIYLQGTEAVTSAAHAMADAARKMESAAWQIDQSLARHEQNMGIMLQELGAKMEALTRSRPESNWGKRICNLAKGGRSGTREAGRRIAVACTVAACGRTAARRPEAAEGPKGAPSSSGSSTGRGR